MSLTTRYVELIADLRALIRTTEECVIALGFWKRGDGGGGAFIWVATPAKDNEYDECIVIKHVANPNQGHWQRVLQGNEVNVRWFGARPTDEFPQGEVPDCTLNFRKATEYLLRHNGGVLRIPAGRWMGHLDWSAPNPSEAAKRLILEGEGEYVTIVQHNCGAILDLSSRTGVTVRDIHFHALPGAETCILACRCANLAGSGTFHRMERVTLTGTPSIAGLYNVGAEVSEYVNCSFLTVGAAPVAFFGGVNDLEYNPGFKISSPESMALTRCTMCRFVKDCANVDDRAILSDPIALESILQGPAALIGSNVSGLVFEQCYFYVSEPKRGCVEIGKPTASDPGTVNFKNVNNLSFLFCHFESKNNAHGIQCNGRGQIQYLTVEGCFFHQQRREHGYYCIHVPHDRAILFAARIVGNKVTNGSGLKIGGQINTSTIVWDGGNAFLAEDVNPRDPTKASTATLLGCPPIHVEDDVLVGNKHTPDGNSTGSLPELVKVTEIECSKDKDRAVITVSPAFQNAHTNHPSSAYVRFGRIELARAANNRIESFAPPVISGSSTGNVFIERGELL